MQNKLRRFLEARNMVSPGDRVVCAVSGGADSVALLFAMYLLKDSLQIELEAAHFNHRLRGPESDRDEAFVRELCHRYDIPLHVGSEQVVPGEKGLEAAARDARYGFLNSLEGKIATAHTADDNAETVLMHMIRGTGLKGLGGITPVTEKLIRPMLTVTRREVEDFNREWCLRWIEDGSNATDAFLRNRLRRHVMPLLKEENPRLAENLSAMALRLREDEACLAQLSPTDTLPDVNTLRSMHPALRSRAMEAFLRRAGVREPEQIHIARVEQLLWARSPSAKADLPGGITIGRNYGRLEVIPHRQEPEELLLEPGQTLSFGDIRVECTLGETLENSPDCFSVCPQGQIRIRCRRGGDSIRLPGGTKSLKKLFIDRKIPAAQRPWVPVIADDLGVLGVYGIGPNLDRIPARLPAVTIRFI